MISSSCSIVPRTSQEKGEKKRAGLYPDAIFALVIISGCQFGDMPNIYSFEKKIESPPEKEASLSRMFPTTVTIGIATHLECGNDVNTLVDAAEKAMKKGRSKGKTKSFWRSKIT